MRASALLALLFVGCGRTPAEMPTEEAIKSEMQKLNGTWSLVSLNVSEIDFDLNAAYQSKDDYPFYVFDDGKVEIGSKGEVDRRGTAKVGLVESPKTLDIDAVMLKDSTTVTVRAIYKLSGDTLTLCWKRSNERPTKFRPGEGVSLIQLKRVKPEA